ncbi:MAG: DUF2318 domain-containing protein [Lachnospiraceae bacterium]|nr:DUF2318 domain-containing protein [Lachnospiraceae bacterium]
MLRYLISATEALMVVSVLTGMLYAYLPQRYGKRGRLLLLTGSVAGVVSACVLAYFKNKTNLIHTGIWNRWIFTVSAVVFLLFVLTDTFFFRKRFARATGNIAPAAASLMLGLQLFYALPDVIATPYNIILGGNSLFSTGFLYRLIGLLLGLLLAALTALAVCVVCKRCGEGVCGLLFKLAFLVITVQQMIKVLDELRASRIITSRTLFRVAVFCSNHASLFLYLVLLIALVIPVLLWVKSFSGEEAYENPAALRKIKARRRSTRRWASVLMICFLLAVLNLTAVKAYANKPVELSAIEDCRQEGDTLVIPFSQVEDGHLHRFAYTTPQGAQVRFIIIKKPNSSAYGIGLDACDICGETGYYERGGQVVCNRCDVVMNINTIGFKGGCNPKLIDYTIEDGTIRVPLSTLDTEENNRLFK